MFYLRFNYIFKIDKIAGVGGYFSLFIYREYELMQQK